MPETEESGAARSRCFKGRIEAKQATNAVESCSFPQDDLNCNGPRTGYHGTVGRHQTGAHP